MTCSGYWATATHSLNLGPVSCGTRLLLWILCLGPILALPCAFRQPFLATGRISCCQPLYLFVNVTFHVGAWSSMIFPLPVLFLITICLQLPAILGATHHGEPSSWCIHRRCVFNPGLRNWNSLILFPLLVDFEWRPPSIMRSFSILSSCLYLFLWPPYYSSWVSDDQ